MKRAKPLAINNKQILLSQLAYKKDFDDYKTNLKVNENDTKFINQKMLEETNIAGDFFGIKYHGFNRAFVVFDSMPPTDPVLYGSISMASGEEKSRLLKQLPNYWLMIDEDDENERDIPTTEDVAKYVQSFYQIWFNMNRIDEKLLMEALTEPNLLKRTVKGITYNARDLVCTKCGSHEINPTGMAEFTCPLKVEFECSKCNHVFDIESDESDKTEEEINKSNIEMEAALEAMGDKEGVFEWPGY
jgi:hypothetical protein